MPPARPHSKSPNTRASIANAPALGGDRGNVTGSEPTLPADRTLPLALASLRDPSTRDQAVNMLVRLGTPALPDLFNLFHDPDQPVRHAAAWALARLKDRRATRALIGASDWSYDYLTLKNPNARNLLADALRHGTPPSRVASALAVARLCLKSSLPDLVEALAHQNVLLRLASIYALGRLGDPSALPYLEDAYHDSDPAVVWLAVYSRTLSE